MGKSNEIDFDTIEKLAKLLSESDLSEIEVEHESLRVRLSRETASVHAVVQQPHPVSVAPPVATTTAPATTAETSPPSTSDNASISGHKLNSPMVGTAYLAPEPDKPPFISIGDTVKKGQTVLIIEAMKTMNHIAADRDGIIKDILVDDAQPVEFGEPLMIIE